MRIAFAFLLDVNVGGSGFCFCDGSIYWNVHCLLSADELVNSWWRWMYAFLHLYIGIGLTRQFDHLRSQKKFQSFTLWPNCVRSYCSYVMYPCLLPNIVKNFFSDAEPDNELRTLYFTYLENNLWLIYSSFM